MKYLYNKIYIMNRSYSKIRHMQESNLRLEKRLISERVIREQVSPTTNQGEPITNKVATEGLKNVTSEMMSSPQFKGTYSGYVFSGVFNNVEYSWDCNGVEGMSGVRGLVDGEIISETIEKMKMGIRKEITDGKPGSPCVGFHSNEIKFIIYTTNSNKPKCVYF